MVDPFNTTTAPTTEPQSIVAGSYVAWRRNLDFDDTSLSLAYQLIPVVGGTTLTVPSVYDGATKYWIFEVTSSVSSAWVAGAYRWDLIVTRLSDSEPKCIATGQLDIFASTDDRRTHAETMVAKIESILSGRADSDVESYSIKSRSITKMSVRELTEWRDYYLREIDRTGGSITGTGTRNDKVRVRWVS